MIKASQLRAWRGKELDHSMRGYGGGDVIFIIGRTRNGFRGNVWDILLCTGETACFEGSFLESETEPLDVKVD